MSLSGEYEPSSDVGVEAVVPGKEDRVGSVSDEMLRVHCRKLDSRLAGDFCCCVAKDCPFVSKNNGSDNCDEELPESRERRGVVTSRIKIPITCFRKDRATSVYNSKSSSPESPTKINFLLGKS